jgi:enediyne biosynthesis protein E4
MVSNSFKKFAGILIAITVFSSGQLVRSQTWVIRAHQLRSAGVVRTTVPDGFVPTFKFTDVSKELGIDFRNQTPEMDPIFKGKERVFFPTGTGVGIADFDQDGWMDILLVNSKKDSANHLYLNQKGLSFKNVAADWGIEHTNKTGATVTPVIFDFDNDGYPDVYLARLGCSMLFRNLKNGFENISAKSGLTDCKNSVGAVPFDYDRNGLTDLYVFRYWDQHDYFKLKTSLVAPENFFNAVNGGNNTLYKNLGNGRFQDVTSSAGGFDTHWALDAAAGDFAHNGETRMVISNDFGPDTYYVVKNKKLVMDSFMPQFPDRRPGMGVSVGDLEHDGKPHLYVSNAYIAEYQQTGNFLWKYKNPNMIEDQAGAWNVDKCGWSWGSLFADFDLDGHQDLYVANGFITDRGSDEYTDYEDLVENEWHSRRRNYAFPEGTVMSLPGQLFQDVKLWPSLKGKSLAGHEVNCVFHNKGTTFEEVSYAVGITKEWDSRAVGGIDFDNNGTMDLLVTTQEGKAHLLQNKVSSTGSWVSFALKGSHSNRDGIGAVVKIIQNGRDWYRWNTGGKSGFLASSDSRLLFGLPDRSPVTVEIRWPSGTIQRLKNLSTEQIHKIREP